MNKPSLLQNNISKKFVLGTTQLGLKDYGISNFTNISSKKKSLQILEYAWKNHIRVFDTAPIYNSEKIIGNFCKSNGLSSKAKIITKLSTLRFRKNYLDYAKKTIETSLNNLCVNKLFCLLIHDTKDINFLKNKMNFFDEIRKTFDIENIGFSIYDNRDFQKGLKLLPEAAFQYPENLLINKVVDYKKKNLFFARSIFLQGFLLNEKIHKKKIPKILISQHKKMHHFFRQNKIDPVELSINYLLSNKRINYYLFGVDNIHHLQKIINIKKSGKIDKEIINTIKSFFSHKINIKGWK